MKKVPELHSEKLPTQTPAVFSILLVSRWYKLNAEFHSLHLPPPQMHMEMWH